MVRIKNQKMKMMKQINQQMKKIKMKMMMITWNHNLFIPSVDNLDMKRKNAILNINIMDVRKVEHYNTQQQPVRAVSVDQEII